MMNQNTLMLLAMIAVMYFFMIMPAQRRAKKEKAFENGLKVGDKIITKSGIHGKIAEMTDDTVVIETMAGKIKMEKSAISSELSAKLAAK
ncbi:preprotein translocase subunit YajC [Flavobacterium celericrescens]|uniref:Sec translocon accessory complex subunit YajC n=1 Tax=Flavobacterium celericrescens TaxID=2709780 RepID=A0ABX0IC27_9FLAO|nr:preprotein translocase subunit YajC [Flavobacterium celericrescens]NHM04743.1 preprotein translocase subunit YajC [Flavobacterium celericrescens]